jgi:DNA-binding response OmpR family regulator
VSEGPGRGSEFIVSLPLAGEGAVASPEADAAAESNGPSCNVLVVEDHDDAANALAMLLRMSGHEVRIAGDGDAALEVCGSFRPDVVLLDIGLPGQDGYEVARQLREILGSEVRLIAVTGYGQEEDRRRSHEAGIDQHVLKPLRPETVEKLLRAPRPRS